MQSINKKSLIRPHQNVQVDLQKTAKRRKGCRQYGQKKNITRKDLSIEWIKDSELHRENLITKLEKK